MARNQRKLVQTALGDIMPPLPFNQIQYADIGDWQGDADHPGWRKVKASLADLCGKELAESAHGPAYAPPPQFEPDPQTFSQSSDTPSKWPLFAGMGVAALAIFGAAAFVMMPSLSSDSGDPSVDASDLDISPATEDLAGTSTTPATRPDIPENWILATVEDPDGHSNVRERPTTSSALVGRVQVGEIFRARRESGKWWPVELSDGTEGFIAKRLIRVKGSDGEQPNSGPIAIPSLQLKGRRVSCSFDNSAFSYDGPCDFVSGGDGDFTTTSLDGPFLPEVTRIGLDVTAPGQGQLKIYYGSGDVEQVSVSRSSQDSACWEAPKLMFCAR
jgi:uncharacterized protein YgiM (DUF1202 family)